MAIDGNKLASLIIGGLFVGLWFGLFLFVDEIGPEWLGWGFLGFAFAGATYAGRVSNEIVRAVIWIVLGIALGLLATAAFIQNTPDIFGTLLTFVGGALVVAGLPGQEQPDDWQPVAKPNA